MRKKIQRNMINCNKNKEIEKDKYLNNKKIDYDHRAVVVERSRALLLSHKASL